MLSDKISLRNTLAQIYHSYNSDTQISETSESSQSKISFFTEFLRRNKMISCRIQNIATVPKQSFHRAYTLYQIDVLTEQLYFTVQKRYSEFQKLNKRIRKFKNLEIKFPKKTYLQSGTQISVTSQRISLLNEYINSILTLGEQFSDIKFMLFQFINLSEKYTQKGVDFNSTDHEYFMANTENVYVQILKLNQNPKIISSILERIRKLIFDYKIKISLETSRQLFFGLQNDKKGLFAFAFSIDNQCVAIQCLQLINDLLNPEMNKASELFLKTLHNCSVKRLIVQRKQLLESLNFKKMYFELLSFYHTKICERDLKIIFLNDQSSLKEFLFWLKGKKNHEIQTQNKIMFQSLLKTETFNKNETKKALQKIKDEIQNFNNQETSKINQSFSQFRYITDNRRAVWFQGQKYVAIKVQFKIEDKQRIEKIDRTKWYDSESLIKSKYSDVITKTLNIQKQKTFKFNENIDQDKDQITLEPIHTDNFDDCFFEFSELLKKQSTLSIIQIIYFCHTANKAIKDCLSQKLQSFWVSKLMKDSPN